MLPGENCCPDGTQVCSVPRIQLFKLVWGPWCGAGQERKVKWQFLTVVLLHDF